MSLHKLTAGSGYDYLTWQVAALDATEKVHTGLASYYTERGESPGVWIGSGLDGIDGLAGGDPVTAEQMRAAFTHRDSRAGDPDLLLRDHEDGLPTQRAYTVGDAVEAWLMHGLVGRDLNTVTNRTSLARTHVIPGLGGRRLAELTVEEIDSWLADKAKTLRTVTLQRLLSILRHSIRRAQARDLVKRNVALLCDPPKGQPGRPSKSLTREQAERLLRAAGDNPTMKAYVVVSLLTGARTEELRALTWSRVNLDGNPPTIELWRSVRAHGDTKTSKSRRTLELPARCVEALTKHRYLVEKQSAESGRQLQDFDLVFWTTTGTPLDSANIRRAFRRVVAAAGMDPKFLDTERAAAQLRLAVVQFRHAD